MSRLSWFATQSGRKFVNIATSSLVVGIVSVKYVPHAFLIDKYVDIFHLYRSGFKVPVSDSLREKLDKCLDILKLPSNYKTIARPIPVFGFDLFHAGYFGFRNGVVIGIPQTFDYASEDDIAKDSIQVNIKPVDWESENGQKLAESLLLTDKEKEFGICREILMADEPKVYIDSFSPGLIIICTYLLNTTINEKLGMFKKPMFLRVILYSLSSLFGLGLYFFIKDFTQVQHEYKTDERLCELGTDFIEAGVSFYNKLLNRNIALRNLMGDQGGTRYTSQGNDEIYFRYPNIPLTMRKEFFQTKLNDLQSKMDQDKISVD